MLSPYQAQIKLDIDTPEEPNLSMILSRLSRAGYQTVSLLQRRSPGGKGWHVIIDVDPLPADAMEVVALQAICGGDPWREAMQMHRARAMRKRSLPVFMRDAWNVLYLPDSRKGKGLRL